MLKQLLESGTILVIQKAEDPDEVVITFEKGDNFYDFATNIITSLNN